MVVRLFAANAVMSMHDASSQATPAAMSPSVTQTNNQAVAPGAAGVTLPSAGLPPAVTQSSNQAVTPGHARLAVVATTTTSGPLLTLSLLGNVVKIL